MADYRSSSPQTSEIFSEDMDSLTAKENPLLNKAVVKYNNNNFKAAYVPVQDVKKPVRGRKTFAFWTLVCLLFMLAIGNLILTMTILGVLKLGQGMGSIELLVKEQSLKFFGNTDFDHIYKKDGKLEGFDGESIEITAEDSSVLVNLFSRIGRPTNKLKIDKNETTFRGFSSFEVKNRKNNLVFSVNQPVYDNLKNANNLKTKQMETNRIRSPIGQNLNIENSVVHLKGAEGTKVEGREIVWRADQDIYLKSINGSIVLSGNEGIYVDVKKIPIATLNRNNYVTAQFKICVCMPQGKLFRVPVITPNEKVYCHHVNMDPQYNPCM